MSAATFEKGTPSPAKAQAPPAGQDLSPEIMEAIAREPNDVVRCVRVFGDHYRCNWWALAAGAERTSTTDQYGALATHRVRKSCFLNVTLNLGKLVIRELPS